MNCRHCGKPDSDHDAGCPLGPQDETAVPRIAPDVSGDDETAAFELSDAWVTGESTAAAGPRQTLPPGARLGSRYVEAGGVKDLFSDGAVGRRVQKAGFRSWECFKDVLEPEDVWNGDDATFCVAGRQGP
jgi:hypothetical protein